MRTLFAVLFIIASTAANAEVIDERAQVCLVEQVKEQFPIYETFQLEYAGALLHDEQNWDAVILTSLPEGNFDRFFISVNAGDYSNASLLQIGMNPQKIDLRPCF